MREIKFRAWDEAGRKMMDVKMFHLDIGKVMSAPDKWDWYKKDRIVMQYTGLKDKNGKEIYEGDIIEHLSFGNEMITGTVYFSTKSGCFALRDKSREFVDLLCRLDIPEVIGNIYENPELLEEVQS